jgi:hypothetical protein
MVQKLLTKNQNQRPSIQDIFAFPDMQEKMQQMGYTMPSTRELMLEGAKDQQMRKMVQNQEKEKPKLSQLLPQSQPPPQP